MAAVILQHTQRNSVLADPVIVRQITVKDFHRFRDRYIPPLDNPVFQTGLRTATQTSMLIAKYGSLSTCCPCYVIFDWYLPLLCCPGAFVLRPML